MEIFKTLCFLLGTWGLILAVPIGCFLVTRRWLPLWGASGVGLVLLAAGIFFGEWLARAMGYLLYGKGPPED